MLLEIADEESEGTKLAFGAENSEDFSSIMAGIIDEVLSKIPIEMDVTIPIDPAFYLVNSDGSRVQYGINNIEKANNDERKSILNILTNPEKNTIYDLAKNVLNQKKKDLDQEQSSINKYILKKLDV